MSKRPESNHAAACKAQVALDALKGEQRLVELFQRYHVHSNESSAWKSQVLAHAPVISSKNKKPNQRGEFEESSLED